MSHKLMAILISTALVFGNVSTSAWSATAASGTVQTEAVQTNTVAAVDNPSPLPAAGAAGIKQAQGFSIDPWLGVGLVVGSVFLLWLLLESDDDDDNAPATTGT